MNSVNDIVCNLLKTPFSRWTDEDKRDVLLHGRPTGIFNIDLKKELKKSGRSYKINFKSSWFSEYNWLCSSVALQKLFCWPCLLFSQKYSVWNRDGFTHFLNITRSLRNHGDSVEHLKCQLMLRNFEQNQNTIADALKENARLYKLNFNEKVRLNRLCLRVVIRAVLFLIKQELPFRGHDEKIDSVNRGDFKELLKDYFEISSLEIKNQYEKIKNVFSGDFSIIQNELIDCIAGYITDHIKNEIKDSQFFSLQIDDTTDITQTSQSSIIIRYVNSKGLLVERFLGFYDVSAGRTADDLFTMATTVLEPFDYQHKLVGQCYDGASVTSGHLNGLQKKIKEHASQAVFVHCLAHRLNLVLQKSFKKISKCRIFFANITGMSAFFHSSAKRSSALTSTSARRMPITDTRWSSNSKLITVIVQDWEKLKVVFENIVNSEDSDDKSVHQANDFLKNMNDFEFTFLTIVFNDIFIVIDILYDVLQKKFLDINFCIAEIKRIIQLLCDKRNEDFFKSLFDKASTVTEIDTSCDVGPRRDAIITKYRALFFEIINHILMEVDVRFQDYTKLKFICLADTTKFETFNNSLSFPSDAFENLLVFYGSKFTKHQRLKNELSLLYADENYRNINLQELIIKLQGHKDVFSEAYTLFCLILTIPSTSVSIERSFSCLKWLKTFTRNSISQERLSSLAVISLHKEFLWELIAQNPFYDDIIDKFASLKDQRIDLVYKNDPDRGFDTSKSKDQDAAVKRKISEKIMNIKNKEGINSEEIDMQHTQIFDTVYVGKEETYYELEDNLETHNSAGCSDTNSSSFQVSNPAKSAQPIVNQKIELVPKSEEDMSVSYEDAQKNITDTREEIDEFDALGISRAAKVRKLDEDQKVLAEDLINQVLTRACKTEIVEDSSNMISFLQNDLQIKSECDDVDT